MSKSRGHRAPPGSATPDNLRGIGSTPSAPPSEQGDQTSTSAVPSESGDVHAASTGFPLNHKEPGINWGKVGAIAGWIAVGLAAFVIFASALMYVVNTRNGVDSNSKAIESVQGDVKAVQESVDELGSDIEGLEFGVGEVVRQTTRIENEISDLRNSQSNHDNEPSKKEIP